jgi:hypothetical protein
MSGELSIDNRSNVPTTYIGGGDPGRFGGGSYTQPGAPGTEPTVQDYENIFGPAGRDVKLDLQRNKRHTRFVHFQFGCLLFY